MPRYAATSRAAAAHARARAERGGRPPSFHGRVITNAACKSFLSCVSPKAAHQLLSEPGGARSLVILCQWDQPPRSTRALALASNLGIPCRHRRRHQPEQLQSRAAANTRVSLLGAGAADALAADDTAWCSLCLAANNGMMAASATRGAPNHDNARTRFMTTRSSTRWVGRRVNHAGQCQVASLTARSTMRRLATCFAATSLESALGAGLGSRSPAARWTHTRTSAGTQE